MRVAVVLLAGLAIAGCFDAGHPVATMEAPALPSLEEFEHCPVANGAMRPCLAADDSPYTIDVRSAIPPAWSCVTFADDRFNNGPSYPDWYTYYGPMTGDGGTRGAFGAGIYYDTHEDTAAVSGAIVVVSQGDDRVFTWSGPAAGFVPLPTVIKEPRLTMYGIIYPEPGPTKGQYDSPGTEPPGFIWDASPELSGHDEFWSQGALEPLGGSSSFGGTGPETQWNLVHNAELDGHQLHLPSDHLGKVAFAPVDSAGDAHWGGGRVHPFNTTVVADGLNVTASLQPYIEFYVDVKDVQDPAYLASSAFLCGCKNKPITTVEGVFCLVGVPPPLFMARTDGFDVTMAAAGPPKT